MRFLLVFFLLVISGATSLAETNFFLEGNLVQGGLVKGRAAPGSKIFWESRPVPVTPTGEFIIGFGRDADQRQRLKVIAPTGDERLEELTLANRTYQVERINGISKRMMNPSESELKRIAEEAEEIGRVRAHASALTHFLEPFDWPVMGRISGVYGSQRIFNGEPRRPHYGIDIAAPAGTIVTAPAGGLVSLAHQDMFFSGKTLVLDHGSGLTSSFLHLQQILVAVGDRIEKGQPIATVGATGRVTGPHLDWRVNWFEQRLDPALLVPGMPGG